MFAVFRLTLKRNMRMVPFTFFLILLTLVLIYVIGNALEERQETGAAYMQGEQWEKENPRSVLVKEQSHGGTPIGIDYYCVQTLLQMLVLGGIVGVFSILEDVDKNTYIRLKSSPVTEIRIMIARLAANICYLFTIAVMIIGLSSFLFGANWSGHYGIIAIAILLHVTIVTGLGMLVGLVSKSISVSIGIMIIFQIIFSKLSGAFGPEPTTGILSYMSPNVHAKNLLYGTIYQGSRGLMIESIVALMVTLLVIFVSFGIVYGWNRRESYGCL